jgi:hypothetical protein
MVPAFSKTLMKRFLSEIDPFWAESAPIIAGWR